MIAPLALAVAAAACASAHAGPAASPLTSEVRATGEFHGLSISTAISVEVAIGKTTRVEVQALKDWLPKLATTVKDGVLVISTPENAKKLPKMKAFITTPDFDSLAISGAVVLTATKVTGDRFNLTVSGVGTIDLAGTVDALRLDASGTIELRAKDLIAETAAVDISGTGDAAIHVTKQLDASISGVANLAVYGKPTVRKRVTGVGSIAVK